MLRGDSLVEPGEESSPGRKRHRWVPENIFEKLFALALLVVLSPLFLLLALMIRWQDGGVAFYRGERLGKNKQPFEMYKFRTLVEGAEQQIGGDLLNHGHQLKTPLGRFLRDSRIDELPQLFNVLRGDMSFFGPRPERRAVYEEQCKDIPGYDQRFNVKPGLMGYSQIFTPHSTPKRLRSLIDNRYSRYDQRSMNHSMVVVYSLFYLGLGAANRLGKLMLNRTLLLFRVGRVSDRRGVDRINPKGLIELSLSADNAPIDFGKIRLVDVNESHMKITTEKPLEQIPFTMRLKIDDSGRWTNKSKNKTATCSARVEQVREAANQNKSKDKDRLLHTYVIQYQAFSELNRYLIDKYLIRKSVL